jgi:hypothetical protein
LFDEFLLLVQEIFSMNEEKVYAFFVRETVAHWWSIVTVDGNVKPMTLREYVDISIGGWIKDGFLLYVSFKEFIEDIKQGYAESKYARILGKNYVIASRLIEQEGKVFLLPSYHEGQVYSLHQVRDDVEYALQLDRDVYGLSGGEVLFEDFDFSRHRPGCRPLGKERFE